MNTNDYTIKDSGKRQEFSTGSRRDTQEGKGRFDLLPPDALRAITLRVHHLENPDCLAGGPGILPFRGLRELAIHFEKGSAKYGDRNWEKGQPISRYLNSGIRHTLQAAAGEVDENHLVAGCWNFLCALATLLRVESGLLPGDLDDARGLGLVATSREGSCPIPTFGHNWPELAERGVTRAFDALFFGANKDDLAAAAWWTLCALEARQNVARGLVVLPEAAPTS